jgi:hypothetical protein
MSFDRKPEEYEAMIRALKAQNREMAAKLAEMIATYEANHKLLEEKIKQITAEILSIVDEGGAAQG